MCENISRIFTANQKGNQLKNVAVLIPTYKPKEYLEKCLLSLERQTLSKERFCVYICLNGEQNPYETYILSLLNNINFKYKYMYCKRTGVSRARNYLIDSSCEEYVVFIDDDDVVSENYLENLLQVTGEKNMGITNIKTFDKDLRNTKDHRLSNFFQGLKDTEASVLKIRKYCSSPWAKMLHRKMIGDIRFDESVVKGEDSLFMAMISKNISSMGKTSNDTCYFIYERLGSATRSKIELKKEFKTSLYLMKKYGKLLFSKRYSKVFVLTRIIAVFKSFFYSCKGIKQYG